MLGSAHGVVVDFAELSDAGRDASKQINEDASGFAETPLGHLAVVCDGMGGHSAGREASQAAVRRVLEVARAASDAATPDQALTASLEQANDAVYEVGGDSPLELRPGSTCVAILLHEGRAHVAHAGDSRAYLVREANIERLTRDHSMVQQLVDSGMLSPAEALAHPEANKITRALGIAPNIEVEVRTSPVHLRAGDTLLLCSDGLTDLVSDPEIQAVVQHRIGNGAAAVCHELVALANSRGGHDNITVVTLHVIEVPTKVTLTERGAGGTLVADSLPTVSDSGPARTVLDEPAPITQPGLTAVDTGDRSTEPGIDVTKIPRFTQDEPPAGVGARPQSARLWTILGIVFALTIVGALAAWGAVRLMHKGHDADGGDEVVPPPPSAPRHWRPQGIRNAPPTTVDPEVEPEVDAAPPPIDAGDAEMPPEADSGFP